MAGETIGWGSAFYLHNGTTLTKLVGVFNITIPEVEVDDVEVTNYDSPNRTREYIAGMKTVGDFEVEMNYVAGSATDLLVQDALADGDVRSFKIIVPDALGAPEREITGTAYCKGYTRGLPVDDRLTATARFKASAAPSEAAAA